MSRQILLPKCAFMWLCCMKLCSSLLTSPRSFSRSSVNRVAELVPSFVRQQSELAPKSSICNDVTIKNKSRRSLACKWQMSVSSTNSKIQKTITVGVSDRASIMANGEPPVPLVLQLTGDRVDLQWDYSISPIGPVKITAEQATVKTLIKRGEYTTSFQLSVLRLAEISSVCTTSTSGVKDTAAGAGAGAVGGIIAGENIPARMLLEQALSLRKQMLVDKIVGDGWRMKKNADTIRKCYDAGQSLGELCLRFDLPPVAIFREILRYRVWGHKKFSSLKEKELKLLVKQGLRGDGDAWDSLMTERDKNELAEAKAVDNMSYVEDDNSERIVSTAWEDSLYTFLDSKNIRYVNEQTFKDAGSKSTPDCVFLDDLYINGKLVRWIDMKCFYGTSNSRHFVMKLAKQAKRYDEEFEGPGAIIYKLGYSESLPSKLPDTLFLDRGPLSSVDPFLTSDSILNDDTN